MRRLLTNVLWSIFFLSFLAACGRDDLLSTKDVLDNNSGRETVVEPATGVFTSPFASAPNSVAPREETSSQGKTLAGITSLWDRNVPRVSPSASEEESNGNAVQIISATEFKNPLPPMRVVHPSLAGRVSSPMKPTESRAGDQAEKRFVDKRPGDAVVRRQGDFK